MGAGDQKANESSEPGVMARESKGFAFIEDWGGPIS